MAKYKGHSKIIRQLTSDLNVAKKDSTRVSGSLKVFPPLYMLQDFKISVLEFININKLEKVIHPESFGDIIKSSFIKHKGNENSIINDADEFIEKEKKNEETTFIVTTEVQGGNLEEDLVTFGKFYITNGKKTKQFLTEKTSIVIDKMGDVDNKIIDEKIYISLLVVAKSWKLAFEIGKIQLEEFEYIFRLILGTNTNLDLGIYNFLGTEVSQHIVSGRGFSNFYGEHLQRNTIDIRLNDTFFERPGFTKLFELISKEERSELENKIIKSGVWVGKALKERNVNVATPEVVFGMETLLGNQSRNFINPSITFTVSSLAAFIYSDDYNERIKCKKIVNDFYSLRSSIVHGKGAIVSMKDIMDCINIIRKIIFNLVEDGKFVDMKTYKDLDEWYKVKLMS
uniref:Apea-like HEPN domain-containing protein n=1 Tax=Listeria seeligeri TaxID=1640 RepID=A0A7T0Q8C8_LISSE|nr:HEPN domain-containing protein [Listeria seeligeri]QPL19394.1 hypothetical protein pLIS400281c [Listeria seeligeri]